MKWTTRLAGLPVEVERARVEVREVAVPGYGAPRPTSVLSLYGRGCTGHGEHVGWTRGVHDAFAAWCVGRTWPLTVGELALDTPTEDLRHRRAAVEGALLDLSLQQAGISLGVAKMPLRYALSFEATRAPAARARAILSQTPGTRFKVDVHPGWAAAELDELAQLDCVDILDGKSRGARALWHRIRDRFPEAILEDAPVSLPGPHALDQALLVLDDVRCALDDGALVNIKAPRMGSWLVALEALELAGTRAYVGGMFEVGPGREQARSIAALLCPDAPNDLAPLDVDPTRAAVTPTPLEIALDRVGFG